MHLPGYPEQAGPCASGRGWCEYTPQTTIGPCCLHCDPKDMLQPSSTRGIYLVAGVKSCPIGVVQDLARRERSSTLLYAQLYAALASRLSCPKLKVGFLSLQHPGLKYRYSPCVGWRWTGKAAATTTFQGTTQESFTITEGPKEAGKWLSAAEKWRSI